MEILFSILAWTFLLYLVIGLLFGIAFAVKGYAAVDPEAAESSIWLRLILIPGAIAMWPVVLLRWIRQ